jgi:hypothetical protein
MIDICDMYHLKCLVTIIAAIGFAHISTAQKNRKTKTTNTEIQVVIKNGTLEWVKNGKEVALYGVNYTTPFAYAYRAHKALNVSLEDAIRNDVYHFARLGFDAFRVHVWDTEISDTKGNLLANEHLRLFDFLLAELKKRNIKTIVTPIAFWGNGYPERDENTPGFSRYFGKGNATINDTAIRAQENYLQQFFTHVNPYTKLSYQQDPDIIATEINNEPNHSGTQQEVTSYIDRLYTAIKNTGWTKPIFYNISENPKYAAATVASKAEGYSFQWYPSGLVGGRTLQSNSLPHVNKYAIPFGDSLPAFKNKPLMVYEFDPADILHPIMYPAMARSFRAAGFQWATQFAYDPMAIAYANTEYQTHFLNLAYTPAKAISMLIAGEVFRTVTRNNPTNSSYPADSVFGPFRISYRASLSEMNSAEKFYYTNHTSSQPVSVADLTHVAGVGNSPVVKYEGTGAYFLDKVEDGVWRLEVMPDAFFVRDPYEKASPSKTVSAIRWRTHAMQIQLPSLGNGFAIKGLNKGNKTNNKLSADRFTISPGTYLLTANGKNFSGNAAALGVIGMNEFVAPQNSLIPLQVGHAPPSAVSSGQSFTITASVWGADTGRVSLLAGKPGWGRPMVIPMVKKDAYHYEAVLPPSFTTPGLIQYRIMVEQSNDVTVFPGNIKGNPLAWDYVESQPWEVYAGAVGSDVTLYNPAVDRSPLSFPSWGRGTQTGLNAGILPGSLVFQYLAAKWPADSIVAMQYAVQQRIQDRLADAATCTQIGLKVRTLLNENIKGKLILVTKDGIAYSNTVELTHSFTEQVLPLYSFVRDRHLLLSRPYPGFLPLWFNYPGTAPSLKPTDIDIIQFVIEGNDNPGKKNEGVSFEIESISLRK